MATRRKPRPKAVEVVGDSLIIFDIEQFKQKTHALAIDVSENGLAILDERTMEWYYLPFSKKKAAHLQPVT